METEGVQQILIITDYYNVWNSFAVLEAIKVLGLTALMGAGLHSCVLFDLI